MDGVKMVIAGLAGAWLVERLVNHWERCGHRA